MYVMWVNENKLAISGRWIISVLHKADKLGLNAKVVKYDGTQAIKRYEKRNGRIKGEEL